MRNLVTTDSHATNSYHYGAMNNIQNKTIELSGKAKLIGAVIRWPVFPLVLKYSCHHSTHSQYSADCDREKWGLLESGKPATGCYQYIFPTDIMKEKTSLGQSSYYFQNGLRNVLDLVERRPQRMKELENSIQAIELWIDQRIAGLARFEADLNRRNKPKPYTRKFA